MKSGWSQEIYEVVKKIPKGKVATYGQISKIINSQLSICKKGKSGITPRMVGMALHKNPGPKNIPCHRVVNRNGRLTPSFAFGGWREQKRRLVVEMVVFKDKIHVDLRKCLWSVKLEGR